MGGSSPFGGLLYLSGARGIRARSGRPAQRTLWSANGGGSGLGLALRAAGRGGSAVGAGDRGGGGQRDPAQRILAPAAAGGRLLPHPSGPGGAHGIAPRLAQPFSAACPLAQAPCRRGGMFAGCPNPAAAASGQRGRAVLALCATAGAHCRPRPAGTAATGLGGELLAGATGGQGENPAGRQSGRRLPRGAEPPSAEGAADPQAEGGRAAARRVGAPGRSEPSGSAGAGPQGPCPPLRAPTAAAGRCQPAGVAGSAQALDGRPGPGGRGDPASFGPVPAVFTARGHRFWENGSVPAGDRPGAAARTVGAGAGARDRPYPATDGSVSGAAGIPGVGLPQRPLGRRALRHLAADAVLHPPKW